MNSTIPRRLEVSADRIINAIKSRPSLYNKSDPNYSTASRHKSEIWREVCKEVYDGWDTLKPHQRVEYDYELRKRWKNLRTAFARELSIQKQEKQGKIRRRKVYAYYKSMKFLINNDTASLDPEFVQIDANNAIDESDQSSDYRDDVDAIDVEVKPEKLEIECYEPEEENEEITQTDEGNVQEDIFSVLKDLRKGEEDEDRQFVLSLVPSLRKLNAKQKFTAKIAILNVLKDVTFNGE